MGKKKKIPPLDFSFRTPFWEHPDYDYTRFQKNLGLLLKDMAENGTDEQKALLKETTKRMLKTLSKSEIEAAKNTRWISLDPTKLEGKEIKTPFLDFLKSQTHKPIEHKWSLE